jgi:hypothetical protein
MIGGEPPGADVKLDVLIDRKQFFFLTYALLLRTFNGCGTVYSGKI